MTSRSPFWESTAGRSPFWGQELGPGSAVQNPLWGGEPRRAEEQQERPPELEQSEEHAPGWERDPSVVIEPWEPATLGNPLWGRDPEPAEYADVIASGASDEPIDSKVLERALGTDADLAALATPEGLTESGSEARPEALEHSHDYAEAIRLFVEGETDLSDAQLVDVEQLGVLSGRLMIDAQQLNALDLERLVGDQDERTQLTIANEQGDPVEVDLTGVDFDGFSLTDLELAEGVELQGVFMDDDLGALTVAEAEAALSGFIFEQEPEFSLRDASVNLAEASAELIDSAQQVTLTDRDFGVDRAEALEAVGALQGSYVLRDNLEALAQADDALVEGADAHLVVDEPAELGVLDPAEVDRVETAENAEQFDYYELELFGGREREMALVEPDEDDALIGRAEEDNVLLGDPDQKNTFDASAGGDNILIDWGHHRDETLEGGSGDDQFVILGDFRYEEKDASAQSSAVLGRPITDFEGENFNAEDEGADRLIDGAGGTNELYLLGDVDASDFDLHGHFDTLYTGSQIRLTPETLGAFDAVEGDGQSTLRLAPEQPGEETEYILRDWDLEGIGEIHLEEDVEVRVNEEQELGGARVLSGEGTVSAGPDAGLDDMTGYSVANSLQAGDDADFENAHRYDDPGRVLGEFDEETGLTEVVVHGDDEVALGGVGNHLYRALEGDNQLLAGGRGDNFYRIEGGGDKTIFDRDGTATIDLSDVEDHGATLSLEANEGGYLGDDKDDPWAEINLSYEEEQSGGLGGQNVSSFNVLLIVDTSGSMGWSVNGETRWEITEPALEELVEIYEDAGADAAFRFVEFDSSANSHFDIDGDRESRWYDAAEAQDVIPQLDPSGATNFRDGLEEGMDAFGRGRGEVFNDQGNVANHAYFIADGMPNRGDHHAITDDWQAFLEEHEMLSRGLGVGIEDAEAAAEMDPTAYDGRTGTDIDADADLQFDELAEVLGAQAREHESRIDNVIGTQADDEFTGNSQDNVFDLTHGGDNKVHVRDGEDLVLGGEGEDIVVFRGEQDEYDISFNGDAVQIEDTQQRRDGQVTVENVEKLEFHDDLAVVDELWEEARDEDAEFLEKLEQLWEGAKDGYFAEVTQGLIDGIDNLAEHAEAAIDALGSMVVPQDGDFGAQANVNLGVFAGAFGSVDAGLNIGAGAQDAAAEIGSNVSLTWGMDEDQHESLRLGNTTEGTLSMPFAGPYGSVGVERYIEFDFEQWPDSVRSGPSGDEEITIGFSVDQDVGLSVGGRAWFAHAVGVGGGQDWSLSRASGLETTLTVDELLDSYTGGESFYEGALSLLAPVSSPVDGVLDVPGSLLAAPLYSDSVSGVLARADEVTAYTGGSHGTSGHAAGHVGASASKGLGLSGGVEVGLSAAADVGARAELDLDLDNPFNPLDLAEYAWETIDEWTDEVWEEVSDLGSQGWDTLTGWSEDAWDAAADYSEQAWEAMSDWSQDAWTAARDLSSDAWGAMSEWSDDAWDEASEFTSDAIEGMATWGSEAWADAAEFGSDVVAEIAGWGQERWENVKDAGREGIRDLIDVADDALGVIREVGGRGWDEAQEFFG